jgi:putative salt-induced outer membrane protein YdiY
MAAATRGGSRRHRGLRQAPAAPAGNRSALPLSAPARTRETRGAYSNDWRVGTRYGFQMVRERDLQLGVEFGAGYRIAPLHDDGVGAPGPVFRGGINLGRRFGERAQWTQRLQFEAGNGERFARQAIGVDVELAAEWMLESDYVIRYDSRGASGSETAEAWFGVRRRF